MKDELKRRVELRFLKKNIRTNRIFILSSMALLVLHRPFHTDIKVMSVGTLLFQMVFTVLIQLAVFSQISFLSDSAKKAPRYVKILAAVSTFGMCCFEAVNGNTLIERFREKLQSLGSRILPGDKIDPCLLLRIGFLLLSVLSAFIVYALTVYIIRMVAERLRELLCSFSQTERKMYAILAVVLIGFVCFSFLKGTAFWGKEPPTDVLFTSDTSNLVRMNAYMSIMHSENDLRQPLFAVFASPFVSIGYAVAFPFSFISPVATPLCMNIVQVLMLVAANLMLAGLLASDSRVRICFVLVFSVTYTSVLFSLMMEQYIVVYFWLIFAIYSAIKKKRADELAVTAAGGTLLTGMALLPLAHDFEEKKDIDLRQMAAEMGKCVALFIVLLLSFGRIDVIMNIFGKTKSLSKFAGGESFWVRIKQYLSFIAQYDDNIQPVADTGYFGPLTRSAVQAFQREYGLTANGQVGVVTWDAITGVYSEMRCGAGKRPYQAPGYVIR